MQTAIIEASTPDVAASLAPLAAIDAARDGMAVDRAAALAALDDLFRSGTVPGGMAGPYRGILVTTTFFPLLDRLIAVWARRGLPWLGKRFTPTGGDNIWRRFPGVADGLFWRLNRLLHWQAVRDSRETYRAFPFRTAVGPGIADADRIVLKIAYNSRPNPLPVRRVLDELVALGDGVYLGKAHGRLLGRWRLCAYFALIGDWGGSR